MGSHRADQARRPHSSATAPHGRHRRTDDPAAARLGRRRGLPSAPLVGGFLVLAVTIGGVVTGVQPPAASSTTNASADISTSAGISVADSVGGNSETSRVQQLAEREEAVSRDSRRDAQEAAADKKDLRMAEAQARQRNAALAKFAQQAEKQAEKIAKNTWVLPVASYRLTNTFGLARSYYSSGYHTGLDFAAPSGTPIRAVAAGTISKTGYSGAYGNQTVQTLEDGTELWYAHQSSISVQPGQKVAAGDVIGTVGSTGNSTGPHLHLEVRPGAGDPVDPGQALAYHGVKP